MSDKVSVISCGPNGLQQRASSGDAHVSRRPLGAPTPFPERPARWRGGGLAGGRRIILLAPWAPGGALQGGARVSRPTWMSWEALRFDGHVQVLGTGREGFRERFCACGTVFGRMPMGLAARGRFAISRGRALWRVKLWPLLLRRHDRVGVLATASACLRASVVQRDPLRTSLPVAARLWAPARGSARAEWCHVDASHARVPQRQPKQPPQWKKTVGKNAPATILDLQRGELF